MQKKIHIIIICLLIASFQTALINTVKAAEDSQVLQKKDNVVKEESLKDTKDLITEKKVPPVSTEKEAVEKTPVIEQNETIEKKAESVSLYDLFIKGGPFMWPILILAAIALGFIIERLIFLRKMNMSTREFIDDLEKTVLTGSLEQVEKLCNESKYSISEIILRGLRLKKHGIERVEKAFSVTGAIQVSKMEKGLNVLSALGNITPMLGFLGTTSGMISAFANIAAADQVNAKIVAGGIEEALLTTAAGLAVAIPTLLFYNYFIHKIDIYVADVERISSDILEKIIEENDAH